MKQNINIEAEGNELVLKNKAGDYVIIPKKYRLEVQDMIKEGCHGCIDSLVETLPVMEDYAPDGSIIPDWDKIKSYLNPKNWGVPDYTDKGTRGQAFAAARKAGEKEFMWNNKRFSTEQLGERRDFPLNKERAERLYKTIAPGSYPSYRPFQKISNVIFNKERMSDLDEITEIRNSLNNLIRSDMYKTYEKEIKDSWNKYYGEDRITSRNIINNKYKKLLTDKNKYLDRLNEISEGYGIHDEDMWRFYLGLPQIDNTVVKSKYIPTNSKDKNITYYTLKELQTPSSINNHYRYKEDILAISFMDEQKFPKQINAVSGLANITVDKGKDERGDYISFYDIYDFDIPFEDRFGRKYEIYDRVYYKDYGDGQKKRMYYSDKELSELDIDKKNFDTLALQKELRNRGYKLPKSTKKDGSFDGVWGDETKNALIYWQNKNKSKPIVDKATELDKYSKFEYKPNIAVQDNTHVAPKVIIPFVQEKEQ